MIDIVACLQCDIYTLAKFYVEGPSSGSLVAEAALSSRFVTSGRLTLSDFATRSKARIQVR